MRHEISIAKKQNNIYLQRADHSKSVGKMVERKAKSGKAVKPLHDPENAKRVVKVTPFALTSLKQRNCVR